MSPIEQLQPQIGAVLQGFVGASTVASGIVGQYLGVVHDSPWPNVHILFGILLCLGVTFRYRLFLASNGQPSRIQIADVSRKLRGNVYLLMYGLVAVKLLLNLGGIGDHMAPPETFRPYLACGVAAILLTRALAPFYLMVLKPVGTPHSNPSDSSAPRFYKTGVTAGR